MVMARRRALHRANPSAPYTVTPAAHARHRHPGRPPAEGAFRVNRTLLQAAQRSGQARVEVRDLYALYPDYLIDVQAEQAALAAARLVVWQHPIHWYGMPPLMKLWLDEVFAFGWAYGPGGDRLRGKDLWLVASTGGPAESYRPDGHNRYFFDAFLPPYEQTAALAGMRFLPPLLLHGAHRVGEAELAAHAELYVQRLAQLPRLAGDRRAGTLRAVRRAVRRTACGLKHGTRHPVVADEPGVPGRGGAGRAAGAAAGAGVDHRLPGGRHRHRALGAEAGHRRSDDPALRRIRRGADAVPGGAGAGAEAAVGAAPADLRLGQRADGSARRC